MVHSRRTRGVNIVSFVEGAGYLEEGKVFERKNSMRSGQFLCGWMEGAVIDYLQILHSLIGGITLGMRKRTTENQPKI